jgi:hypothetical protein
METGNPELQHKLQQLELEFEASCSVSKGRRRVWVSSRARVGCALIQVGCWGCTPTYELVLTFVH